MSDEDAFLRAICDQPDEDTPRLAFADFLNEEGSATDAAWAELIRVQVPLARGPGADRDRLTARERELTPLVAAAWAPRFRLPEELTWRNWVRGFPLTVAGPGERIRAAYPRFAGRVPLREFNLRAATDDDLVALAGWPEARLVGQLGVWSDATSLTDTGFLALVRSEYLSGLERLRLEHVRLTDHAALAFLDSPLCAGLQHVKLRLSVGGDLSDDVWQRLRGRFGEYDVY